MNRRHFMQTTAGAALAAGWPGTLSAETPKRAVPFRVLYSNDLTNVLSTVSPWHKKREAFRPEMIEATVDEVANTGVEVHLLQPGVGWVPWWQSKVYPAAEHYRWLKETYGIEPDTIGSYVVAGGDVVKVFIDRCRKRGQVPFISLRMNDGHHKEWAPYKKGDRISSAAGQGLTKFYCEHLDWRIGPEWKNWDQRVLNWAIPEVRAHKLSFIQELCENYDLDGFEMDFMRHPSLFQLDKTTSEQRRNIMTGFVRQVREVLDRTARGGRRRWLCARIPCFVAALDPLGMDVAAMVEAGLDMVNVSASYFTIQQTDFPAIRQMAGPAAAYLEFCHSIWNGPRVTPTGYDSYLFRRATPGEIQTAAHLAYARGGAGVCAFNFVYYREHGGPGRGPFNEPPFEVFKHLGDREWLARQPQHWFLSSGWGCPYVKQRVLPRRMGKGQSITTTLDLAPPAGGWQHGGRLRIQGDAVVSENQWRVKLNDTELTPTEDLSEPYPNPYSSLLGKPEEMRAWQVPAGILKDGGNRLEITITAGKPARVEYLDLALR